MSNENQGEGNRDAARNYNEETKEFVESGGVDANKGKHEDMTDAELESVREAAEKAKEKAKK